MTVEPDTTRTEPLPRLEEGPDAPTERARIEVRSPWALAWQRLRRDRPVLVAAAARAGEVLGWHPARPDLGEMVASAWGWRRRNPHGYGD